MSYGVVVSFDLQDATGENYRDAYADLAALGFARELVGGTKTITLPTTMAYGKWNGTSDITVRDEVVKQVTAAFNARKFVYELFVAVGGPESTWSHTDTRPKK